MSDLTPNLPDVVAEVRALFERYEQALIDKDVDVLDGTWRGTIRPFTRAQRLRRPRRETCTASDSRR
jgi:hypothetical protein